MCTFQEQVEQAGKTWLKVDIVLLLDWSGTSFLTDHKGKCLTFLKKKILLTSRLLIGQELSVKKKNIQLGKDGWLAVK